MPSHLSASGMGHGPAATSGEMVPSEDAKGRHTAFRGVRLARDRDTPTLSQEPGRTQSGACKHQLKKHAEVLRIATTHIEDSRVV